ncbi:hypothetical protein BGZ82_000373 [Podila clonocystis]|nr:hypothetical protein BGZ82_000373 [Podila clonocystis]
MEGSGYEIITVHSFPNRSPAIIQFLLDIEFKGGDPVLADTGKVLYWKEMAFEIEVSATRTIAHFKDLIKTKQAPAFDDITGDQLTLWRAFIPADSQVSIITIDAIDVKKKLNNPRTRLSNEFSESPDDNTYIIVQRPPPGNAALLL